MDKKAHHDSQSSGSGTRPKNTRPNGRARPDEVDLPHAPDMERGVLGSLLLDNAALKTIEGLVEVNDFYAHSHRITFNSIVDLIARGRVADEITVVEDLRQKGLLEQAGGAAEIATLTDGVPHGGFSHVQDYARIVKDKANARNLINLFDNGIARVGAGEDAQEILTTLGADLEAIRLNAAPVTSLADLRFPASALIGTLGALARTLAAGTEVPEEFYFVSALTLFGNHCSKRLEITADLDVEARLYTVLLGESYDVKKSTALHRTIDFFSGFWTEGPALLSGMGSAEGLARKLKENNHVVLYYDELISLLDKTSVQGSVLLPMVTSLFESRRWHNHTKANSIEVADAHLSLVGCATLETYEQMWTSEAIAIGFLNRLFVVMADRKPRVAWPAPRDTFRLEEIRWSLADQLKRLPIRFDITPEAREIWTEWCLKLPSSIHARRLDTIGFRLMGPLALTSDKSLIDVDIIQPVIDVLNYELRVRTLTDPINADSAIAKAEGRIRKVLAAKGPLRARQLHQFSHANRSGLWIFKQALSNLEEAREVVRNRGFYHLLPREA